MKINELILENNDQLDEISLAGVGKGIAKGANVAGQTVGALGRGTIDTVKQFGQGFKQGWQGTKAAMSGNDDAASVSAATGGSTAASVGGSKAAGLAPGGGGSTSAPTTGAAPAISDTDLDQIKSTISQLNPDQKKELAGELEKSINAPVPQQQPAAGKQPAPVPQQPAAGKQPAPQGAQSLDLDQLKQQSQARQAQGQADQQAAVQQMKQTQQANTQSSQADNALVAAVKAAKAKPGFQQTAQDKLTIQQGAAKGIHESKKKKKKIVAEFKSKFLGQII